MHSTVTIETRELVLIWFPQRNYILSQIVGFYLILLRNKTLSSLHGGEVIKLKNMQNNLSWLQIFPGMHRSVSFIVWALDFTTDKWYFPLIGIAAT